MILIETMLFFNNKADVFCLRFLPVINNNEAFESAATLKTFWSHSEGYQKAFMSLSGETFYAM